MRNPPPPSKPQPPSGGYFSHTVRKHAGMVLIISLLLLIKNAPLFMAGQFVSEDSFYFFASAYNKPLLESLTTPYAGYLHILPMLLAEGLWLFPFEILPWINHLVSLLIGVTLMSWLYSPLCRNLIESDGIRFACVFVLAMMPFQPNLGMLLGLHWYFSFFLGIFFLGHLPRRTWAVAASCCLVVLMAWSAPASILLIPLAAYRWWTERRKKARYIPLCFAAASIAYLLAIALVFKPASAQPNFAPPLVALQGGFKLLQEGVLLQSVLSPRYGAILPSGFAITFKLILAGSIAWTLWMQRKKQSAKYSMLLIGIAFCTLGLTMIRGHQSQLLIAEPGLHSERYLTTPTLYLWTACAVLFAPFLKRLFAYPPMRHLASVATFAWLLLLFRGGAPLHGERSLDQAFPHSKKVALLAKYEERVASGGQAETLALPGWTPIECMRLEVGGGRNCESPSSLGCVFGTDLKQLSVERYVVDWLGEFAIIDPDWVSHHAWGRIAVLGYSNGFYWFQEPSGQKFLSGPAIYPDRFLYPPQNLIRIESK